MPWRRQVTPEVSRLAVFQMACQNLMSATRSLMSDPRVDCTWKLDDRSLIDFTLTRSMNVKICRCFWTQLSKSFCFFTKLQAVIKNLGGKRRNLGNVRAVWNPFVKVFNKSVFSRSRALLKLAYPSNHQTTNRLAVNLRCTQETVIIIFGMALYRTIKKCKTKIGRREDCSDKRKEKRTRFKQS